MYFVGMLLLVEVFAVNAIYAASGMYLLVVLFNYVMHYYWSFEATTSHGQTSLRYLVMNGIAFVLNTSILYIGIDWLQWHYLIAQAVGVVVIVLWNFVMSRQWVYKSPVA